MLSTLLLVEQEGENCPIFHSSNDPICRNSELGTCKEWRNTGLVETAECASKVTLGGTYLRKLQIQLVKLLRNN